MAGLDYSNVIEPDFHISKVTQSNDVTKYIEKLTEQIYSNWKNKDILSNNKFGDKQYVTETKRIYYDTSNIMEHQVITYKRCDKCPGVTKIESTNDKNDNILAINIPLGACRKCQTEGQDLFNNNDVSQYTNVYLQDRVNDFYHQK